MEDIDTVARTIVNLCKQGRADEALRIALKAEFRGLIVGLNKMADACGDSARGQLDRDYIFGIERVLLDLEAGRPAPPPII